MGYKLLTWEDVPIGKGKLTSIGKYEIILLLETLGKVGVGKNMNSVTFLAI